LVAKLFYAITLLILGNGPLASFSRPQATSVPSSPPVFYLGPTTGYSAALPNANDVLRFRRGERYNIPDPSVPELGEGSEPGILSLPFTIR